MGVLVIGSSNVDVFCRVDRLPEKGETIFGNEIEFQSGGKGANQATAASKMGSETIFLTCLGNDENGHNLIEQYKKVGINTEHIKFIDGVNTGTAFINVDKEGSNTIVVVKGANNYCDDNLIIENEEIVKGSDYVLLQLEIPIETVRESIKISKKYGKTVIVNPAPAQKLDDDILKNIDFLTPNETELELLAFGNIVGRNVEESAEVILNKGVKHLLVTIGEKGVVYFSKDNVKKIEGLKVNAIDTVAAGDCFNGAFVSALDKGESIIDAIKFANKAAAISVTRKGAQESIPNLEEVLNYR